MDANYKIICKRCTPSCSANQYRVGTCGGMDNYLCAACPLHAFSPAGSTSETQCTCVGGYVWKLSATGTRAAECHTCRECAVGQYRTGTCSDTTDYTCSTCPPHSTSAAGSKKISACKCIASAGYRDNDPSPDLVDCVLTSRPTAAPTVSPTTAAPTVQQAALVTCAADSFRDLYVHTDGTFKSTCKPCSQCGVNRYRTAQCGGASDTVCDMCPLHATSGLGSTSINDCRCANGFFFGVDPTTHHRVCNQCTLCEEGLYEKTHCSGTLDSKCTACPAHSRSPTGSTDIFQCVCDADHGYIDADPSRTGVNCVIDKSKNAMQTGMLNSKQTGKDIEKEVAAKDEGSSSTMLILLLIIVLLIGLGGGFIMSQKKGGGKGTEAVGIGGVGVGSPDAGVGGRVASDMVLDHQLRKMQTMQEHTTANPLVRRSFPTMLHFVVLSALPARLRPA